MEPKTYNPIENKEKPNNRNDEFSQFRYTKQDYYGDVKLPEYSKTILDKYIVEPAKVIPISRDNPSKSSEYKRYTSKQRPVYKVIDRIIKKCHPDEEGTVHPRSDNCSKKSSQKKVTFNTEQSNEVDDFGKYVFTQPDDNSDAKLNSNSSAVKHNIKIKVEEDQSNLRNNASKYPSNGDYFQYGTKLESSSFKRFRNFDPLKDNSYKVIPEVIKTPAKWLNKYEPIRQFKSDDKSRTHNLDNIPFHSFKNVQPEILNNRFLSSVEINNQNKTSDYNVHSTKNHQEDKKVS